MITKENLSRHELIGLDAEVVDSQNKASIGIKGKVIDEMQKSLLIREGTPKRVFKDGTKFRFTLPNKTEVELDGKTVIGRPWERIKN